MNEDLARRFAEEWYAAWNAHDLEAIMEHYSEDVVYWSHYAATITGDPSGLLHGKSAVRAYFELGLARLPDLLFVPRSVAIGVGSLVLNYHSVSRGLDASELFVLDESGKATEVRCHYGI